LKNAILWAKPLKRLDINKNRGLTTD